MLLQRIPAERYPLGYPGKRTSSTKLKLAAENSLRYILNASRVGRGH